MLEIVAAKLSDFMQLYTIDPLLDHRWNELVAHHPAASVFHQSGWLKALALTYRYRPLVLTATLPQRPLSDGIVFCEVRSWITGDRLVSLPFADHCEPLVDGTVDSSELLDCILGLYRQHQWKYIQLRPLSWEPSSKTSLAPRESFWFHTLSLEPSLDQLFRNLHRDCVQRRIRHAERSQLSYQRGASDALLDAFYGLLVATRKRHRLFPQPRAWFKNLLGCMSPNAEIRLLRQDYRPVAAILTLRHRGTIVYKYGCSAEDFHHLGGMPLLFWNLIAESKAEGAESIDFGRTDVENESLVQFKDRFGTTRREIKYYRHSESGGGSDLTKRLLPLSNIVSAAIPKALSPTIGNLVYRHIA